MTNIGVIILNYLVYDVTINCVESFKKQTQDDINMKIIVVDNSSGNESYDVLRDKYDQDSQVIVIKTESNLGFANGNNAGYFKLLEIMKPDFVICSNSDIILENDGLFPWILNCMKRYDFGILGPSIYSVFGKFYQNPVANIATDTKKLVKMQMDMDISLAKIKIKMFLGKTSSSKKDSEEILKKIDYKKVHQDMTLHGAFQIMSYRYFEVYDEPYDPRTFMYMEEDLLKLRSVISNLPMIYDPQYNVLHLQAISTKSAHGDSLKKDYMKVNNMRKSLKVYRKLAKEVKND